MARRTTSLGPFQGLPAPKKTRPKPRPKVTPQSQMRSRTRAQRGYAGRPTKPKPKVKGPTLRQIVRQGAGLPPPPKKVRLKTIPLGRSMSQKTAQKVLREQAGAMKIRPLELGTRQTETKINRALRSRDPYQRRAAAQLRHAMDVQLRAEAKSEPALTRQRARQQQARKSKTPGLVLDARAYSQRKGLFGEGSPLRLVRDTPKGAKQFLTGSGEYGRMRAELLKRFPDKITVPVPTVKLKKGKRIGVPGAGAITIPFAADVGVEMKKSTLAANAIKDLYEIPQGAVTSAYLTALAGAKAVGGNTKPAEELAKTFVKTDPLALLVQGKRKQALRAAKEHPVGTALELIGVKSVAGHTIGAGMRRGTPKMRRAASTKRAPEHVYGDLYVPREYSGDIFKKGTQKLGEKFRAREGLGGEYFRTRRRLAQAERLADEDFALGEGIRREDRDQLIYENMPSAVRKKIRSEGRKLKSHERDLLGLVNDRVIRSPKTAVADLKQYRQMIVEAGDKLRKADNPNRRLIKAHERTVKRIDAALAKGIDGEQLHKVVREYGEAARKVEADFERQGTLPKTRAEKAREVPYAVVHMGAKEVDPIPEWRAARRQLAATRHKARVAERAAYRKYVRRQHSPEDVRVPAKREWEARVEDLKAASNAYRDLKRPKGPELRDAEGKKLTTADIRAHREAAGVEEPAFYRHAVERNMRSAALVNKFEQRGSVGKMRRTGEATRAGTADTSYEAVQEHLIRATGLRDWVDQFDGLIRRFAPKDANRRLMEFDSIKQANEVMQRQDYQNYAAAHKLPDMVPVRVSPFNSSRLDQQHIMRAIEDLGDNVEAQQATEGFMARLFDEAENEGVSPQRGSVVLMPRHIWERAKENYAPSTGGRKSLQLINGMFKNTVLPTSPKWIAGNIVDNLVRLAISGAGPRDYFLAAKLQNELAKVDPKMARELRIRALGGMHFSTRGRMQVKRGPEDFSNPAAAAAGRLTDAQVTRIATSPWKWYRDFVFEQNSRLEKIFEQTALGRSARREIRHMTGKWEAGLRVQPKAMEDLVNGLRGTDAQIKLAREVRKIVGNWNTFSPEARKWLNDYLPFGTWMRNALGFVYVTMPRDHPIVTGALAAMSNMTAEERQQLGLDPRAKNSMPTFLQGSIPTGGGKVIPTGGLTSFGFAGNFAQNAASMPFAPLQSPFLALRLGTDWKGTKLKNADGSDFTQEQRLQFAAYSFMEAITPLAAIARRFREQGGTSQAGSTVLHPKVKQGTKKGTLAGVEKWANPFAAVPGGRAFEASNDTGSAGAQGTRRAPPTPTRRGGPRYAPPPPTTRRSNRPRFVPPPGVR